MIGIGKTYILDAQLRILYASLLNLKVLYWHQVLAQIDWRLVYLQGWKNVSNFLGKQSTFKTFQH